MAKFVGIAAVCLAAAVVLAVAIVDQGEQQMLRDDVQCQRELQESPLDACRQVLHQQQLTSGGAPAPFRWITGLRTQCCQQLRDVSRECRCAAIRRMVRGYEQTMPPLEEGGGGGYYGGESSTGHGYFGQWAQCSQQQGGGYSGWQPGGGYYGGAGQQVGWQQGGGYYGGAGQQGGQGYGCGCGQRREEYGSRRGQQQPTTTRVKLSKVRLHAARLPTMCEIEPQECSVFSGAGS